MRAAEAKGEIFQPSKYVYRERNHVSLTGLYENGGQWERVCALGNRTGILPLLQRRGRILSPVRIDIRVLLFVFTLLPFLPARTAVHVVVLSSAITRLTLVFGASS